MSKNIVELGGKTHDNVADVWDDEEVGHAAVALEVPALGDVVAPVDVRVRDGAQLLQDHRPVAHVVHKGTKDWARLHNHQVFDPIDTEVLNKECLVDASHSVITGDHDIHLFRNFYAKI